MPLSDAQGRARDKHLINHTKTIIMTYDSNSESRLVRPKERRITHLSFRECGHLHEALARTDVVAALVLEMMEKVADRVGVRQAVA